MSNSVDPDQARHLVNIFFLYKVCVYLFVLMPSVAKYRRCFHRVKLTLTKGIMIDLKCMDVTDHFAVGKDASVSK